MSNKLGDYIEFKNGLNYDKTHKGNGCKIVGVANFKNNLHINFENLDEVKSDIVSDDMLLKNDDLLFVRSNGNKSLVGRCLFVSDLQEKMSFSGFTIRARIKNKQKLLPKYFLYYATAPNFKNSLYKKIGGGTNIRNLTQAVLEDINIELPELDNQKKIANCLDQITQKIQLNNKINDELEKLAKTLYEYWFVQFDFPDENNRPYKSSGGKMIYNEKLKRNIPYGWSVNDVKSCITHINTGLNPRNNFILNNGNIKYITVKNLTTHGSVDFSNCDTIDEVAQKIVHKRSDISTGDILFASIAPLGRCYLIQEEPQTWDINESVFSIRPKNTMPSEYLYMFLTSKTFVKKAENSSTGSVFAGIRIKTLADMLLVVPENNILQEFKDKISKILLQKHIKECENQKLIQLRNFLLPMLMNGQISVIAK